MLLTSELTQHRAEHEHNMLDFQLRFVKPFEPVKNSEISQIEQFSKTKVSLARSQIP